MRDVRDPAIIGAEILRLVKVGWPVRAAADVVCRPLPETTPEPSSPGRSGADLPGAGGRLPLDFSGAQEHSWGEA